MSRLLTALTAFALMGVSLIATSEEIEEVVVTGSYIKGTPEDAALPVDVVTRADLEDVGDPTIIEMVRNLGVTSGNAGETNQFASIGQGTIGTATINLRGLGSARTLVLINGRRQVGTETLGVDINAIPSAAIGRVEVLKDGAAALYGSDAIGGVVNFITRGQFEGLEIRGSNQFIDDAGDREISAMYGYDGGDWGFTISHEWEERDELTVPDRSWATPAYLTNPQAGWSSIGNPGSWLPAAGGSAISGTFRQDPGCTQAGGFNDGVFCRFRYTLFDNLIEETESNKTFAEFNWDINDVTSLHIEALHTEIDIPEWNTSPSYPPQALLGPDRFVPPTHPALIDMKTRHPELFSDVDLTAVGFGVIPVAFQGVMTWSRMVGFGGIDGGQPEKGERENQYQRLSVSLEGIVFDDLNYEFAVSWSDRQRYSGTNDMYVERMAFAIEGLGGPNCDVVNGTPGVGGCEYYNPFSTAIESSVVTGANPDFNPALANSEQLLDWLTDTLESDSTNELLVFDAVFSSQTDIQFSGGNMSWAAGAQVRRERYDLELNDVTNLAVNPCPFNNPQSVVLGHTASLDCGDGATGLFAFLSGTTEESTSRRVYGYFAELALPLTDSFDIQAAIRFEDYGGNVGSTLDPKVAARWQINDWATIRSSISTTFRGPPQSLLTGQGTALAFVGPTTAFKAIDTRGNPNLDPETANTFNLGFIAQTEAFYGSIDYWSFKFKDPLQLESFNAIVNAYSASGCEDGGAGVGSADCATLRAQIFPLGTPAAGLQRIVRNWTNGADIDTNGVDLFAEYTFFNVAGGDLSVGLEGTYTFEYDSDPLTLDAGIVVSPAQDYVGRLNDINSFTPIPELKGNIFAKYIRGNHSGNIIFRYIDDYEDTAPATPALASIDDHVTIDFNYNWQVLEDLRFSLSVINAADEDPPAASLDLNYDPLTHNAFGRMVKVGLTWQAF